MLASLTMGCGASKEEAALAHFKAIKRPGWVRVVNLSADPVTLDIDAAKASGEVATGDKSIFVVTKAGKHRLSAKSASGESVAENEPDVKSGESVSLYVLPGKAFKTISGEPREIMPSGVRLQLVNLTSQAPDVIVGGKAIGKAVPAGGSVAADFSTPGKAEFVISGGGKKATLSGEMADGHAYSLALYETGGKINAVLVENSPKPPGMAGAGAA